MNPHVIERSEAPTPSEQSEREKLSKTPGLTREQARAVRDPSFPLRSARVLLDVLQKQAAAQFESKPESEKALARAMGQTKSVSVSGVVNDGAKQTFGGSVEVAR